MSPKFEICFCVVILPAKKQNKTKQTNKNKIETKNKTNQKKTPPLIPISDEVSLKTTLSGYTHTLLHRNPGSKFYRVEYVYYSNRLYTVEKRKKGKKKKMRKKLLSKVHSP